MKFLRHLAAIATMLTGFYKAIVISLPFAVVNPAVVITLWIFALVGIFLIKYRIPRM